MLPGVDIQVEVFPHMSRGSHYGYIMEKMCSKQAYISPILIVSMATVWLTGSIFGFFYISLWKLVTCAFHWYITHLPEFICYFVSCLGVRCAPNKKLTFWGILLASTEIEDCTLLCETEFFTPIISVRQPKYCRIFFKVKVRTFCELYLEYC